LRLGALKKIKILLRIDCIAVIGLTSLNFNRGFVYLLLDVLQFYSDAREKFNILSRDVSVNF
jgi:hypothetical protein